MNSIPLRKRYFRDVVRMGLLILGVCIIVLTTFNAFEYWDHRGDGPEELLEMVILFAALVAVFPVVILMAWQTSGRLLRPLKEIQNTAERIRTGELDQRAEIPGGKDELQQLAESLNQAFDAHQQAQRKLEEFSQNVSHQLRTPLTVMRTTGEVALSQPRTPGEYQEALGHMLEQAERLTNRVNQLLLLAKVAGVNAESDKEPFDLVEVTGRVMDEFRPLWEDRNASWETDVPETPVLIEGNPWWMKEALSNLINNALAYTPDPASFRLTISSTESGDVLWKLEDSGPGIPEEHQDQLFERFHRGPHSDKSGTGLGLAIVREVVHLHDGRLRVEESSLGGAAFVIAFKNPERLLSTSGLWRMVE